MATCSSRNPRFKTTSIYFLIILFVPIFSVDRWKLLQSEQRLRKDETKTQIKWDKKKRRRKKKKTTTTKKKPFQVYVLLVQFARMPQTACRNNCINLFIYLFILFFFF